MRKGTIIFVILILSLIPTVAWGEGFWVNYYHKGEIVHQRQIQQGAAIGSHPEITLPSCNDNFAIFVGWILESDKENYLSANTVQPDLIAEEYTPTSDINLYAVFADNDPNLAEDHWMKVTSASGLKHGDQIIIAASNSNYAMSKTIKDKQFTAIEITKSEDKTILYPTDEVQILTLHATSSENLWGLYTGEKYLQNLSDENTIGTMDEIKNHSSWGFTFINNNLIISNNYTKQPPYLFFNSTSKYFACRKKSESTLSIYKRTQPQISYIICNQADPTEISIKIVDGDNTWEITRSSNQPLLESDMPTPRQANRIWNFYGWAYTPVTQTIATPEIISFPFVPSGDITLHAVYTTTTDESLIMENKTIPATWIVDETNASNTKLSIYKDNFIKTATIENITQIDIEMRERVFSTLKDQYLKISTNEKEYLIYNIDNTLRSFSIKFDTPTTTSLKFTSTSIAVDEGIAIESITIHQPRQYCSNPPIREYLSLSFDCNGGNDTCAHYNIKQQRGDNIILPSNSFSYSAKDFIEWNSTANGTGARYDNQDIFENIQENTTLYAQWGILKIVDTNEIWVVEENYGVDRLIIHNGLNGNIGEISISHDASIDITKDITVEKIIDGSKFYFFALPFDCNIADIKAIDADGNRLTYAKDATSGDFVINYYDQTVAAQNAGDINKNAWIELLGSNHTLHAGRGYIIGHFGDANEEVTIKFRSADKQNITAPGNRTLDFDSNYKWYSDGKNQSACGWNLIGNPYYETIAQGSLSEYVTIPNDDGKTYSQCLYSEALGQGLITPLNAFFIQQKSDEAPTFSLRNSEIALLSLANNDCITIEVAAENSSDRTTVINCDDCTSDYEIGRDLKKWIGYADKIQLYSIENNIPLAFNSRTINENTTIALGIYAPVDGEYSFSCDNSDTYLLDKTTQIITNISKTSYSTVLNKGLHEKRFEILFETPTITTNTYTNLGIEYFQQHDLITIQNLPENTEIYLYDSTGKLINQIFTHTFKLPKKGVYHAIIREDRTIIKNFTIIY